MQLLLYGPLKEEIDILKYALQQAGIVLRVSHQFDQIKKDWTTQPADAALVIHVTEDKRDDSIIKEFRSFTSVPMLVISDLLPEEFLLGLYQAGADLVVTRPYSIRILTMQLRALIQRSNNMPLKGLPSLTQGDLILDPATRSVSVHAQPGVHLTQLEFRMLYTLMTQPGRILTAEELVEKVWGYHGEGNRELVRGLIQRVRIKIEPDTHNPTYIHTEPGVGYYFRINPA
jgi:DNA-binding response OmpR family regulator